MSLRQWWRPMGPEQLLEWQQDLHALHTAMLGGVTYILCLQISYFCGRGDEANVKRCPLGDLGPRHGCWWQYVKFNKRFGAAPALFLQHTGADYLTKFSRYSYDDIGLMPYPTWRAYYNRTAVRQLVFSGGRDRSEEWGSGR